MKNIQEPKPDELAPRTKISEEAKEIGNILIFDKEQYEKYKNAIRTLQQRLDNLSEGSDASRHTIPLSENIVFQNKDENEYDNYILNLSYLLWEVKIYYSLWQGKLPEEKKKSIMDVIDNFYGYVGRDKKIQSMLWRLHKDWYILLYTNEKELCIGNKNNIRVEIHLSEEQKIILTYLSHRLLGTDIEHIR